MRAFLAVELPAKTRAQLAEVQRRLAESRADVAWVAEAQLHVTLRFLGEIDDPRRRRLVEATTPIIAARPPVAIGLARLGAFPSSRSPRVVWVGIDQGQDALQDVVRLIEPMVREIGIPAEERAFVAHVTLGRVRSPRRRAALVDRIQREPRLASPPFRAESITLFQSVLSAAGPRYTVLAALPFAV